MCRPISVSGKAVVLESWFYVDKGITYIESKGVYASIKKWHYWKKGVPGDLVDTHFEYKEVNDVGMIEVINKYNKLLKIFWMKETDYVMKIMVSWMALDALEGARTRIYFTYISGTNDTKQSTYQHKFGIHFRYRHQLDDHNNQTHVPISLDRTWTTKFLPDCKFSWYLSVFEVNTDLASGQFKNYGIVQPSLDFRRSLAI